ncbi:C-type lectin domain family 2 member D isoform X2 [Chelonia mydas]|uniref:C-type lectin domain family 2 member D isoform X2 n=1 Tax=Chelonia mydas TaxID=8469 RepID=UPI0018A1BA90|nr:C-type lectin domain family 2 member D isoform X2 [Chelonia mydas]
MGPAAGAAESEEPLQELCVNGSGHRETGGNPDPPCNCQKSLTCGVVVALIVVSSALIAVIIALAVLASKLSSADLCPPAGPSCPDGWMGYRGKCYYFSETEGSWTDSQSRCSAPGASLAGIDSEQEMAFLLRHKDFRDHWIGLRREQGQPWKWANGTEFKDLFQIRGGGDCAYLNDEKGVSSSRCYMERRWICSKPEVYVMGKETALEGGSK